MPPTFFIKFPRNREFALILGVIFGAPMLISEDILNQYIFYNHEFDSIDDIRYNVSRYLADIYRKSRSHQDYVALAEFLNEQVIITDASENRYKQFKQCASIDKCMEYGLI